MLNNLQSYLKLLPRLGVWNVMYVLWYRFTLKVRLRKYLFPAQKLSKISLSPAKDESEYDLKNYAPEWKRDLLKEADKLVKGELIYFGYHSIQGKKIPDWFFNPFNQTRVFEPDKHWTELSDFNLAIGDIKTIWEPSRFEWLLTLSRAFGISGNKQYLDTIEEWLNDWCKNNPLNVGPNWKCGQETSIRVMHMITASFIIEDGADRSGFAKLIEAHLKRIKPNIRYAVAQDNNHGTSEAAALYIGCKWLINNGFDKPFIKDWAVHGLEVLKNRIDHLIMDDGTFSQYSITYHRMVLNTLSWVLWNEDKLQLNEGLNEGALNKIDKAIYWYQTFIDKESGDAPNFGPNDGSFIFRLHSNDYREFRPALRLIKNLRKKQISEDLKHLDEPLFWLKIDPLYGKEEKSENRKIFHFPDGGFIRQNGEESWLLFHYPMYKFRPSDCDFLHVDLWHKGLNILRDSGSYSYNTGKSDQWSIEYFKSIFAHNTVILNERNPISKVSRFLYADWPGYNVLEVEEEANLTAAAYNYNNLGNHKRQVEYLHDDSWLITDILDGKYDHVALKWHLFSVQWKKNKDEQSVESKLGKITIESDSKKSDLKIVEEAESRFYKQKQLIPVLQFRSDANCTKIKTTIQLK